MSKPPKQPERKSASMMSSEELRDWKAKNGSGVTASPQANSFDEAAEKGAKIVGKPSFDPKIMPVLMCPEQPEGWTLEALTDQLIVEIQGKSRKIEGDPRPVARLVMNNNARIIEMLREIRRLKDANMSALALLGPNEGLLGKPRIGEGSDQ